MKLTEKLKHKYALSDTGAKGMIRAVAAVTVSNIVLMLPVGLLYMLVSFLLDGELPREKLGLFIAGIAGVLILIAATTLVQYRATFFFTYVESGVRRRTLAEKLRKIPLSFFGRKDLADLTNTIMSDCATIETASSHWIPELVGSLISTAIVVISLFFFNWKMAIAAVWVMPVAFIIVLSSKKVMNRVGENGSELSGGERQRISIARAFLKDAPIILMDEATASLDVDNESLIQESISKLIRSKTVLIIAHRMRTVDGVDKIVVLKDGRVAETGTPAELKKAGGIYRHMADMQLSSEQWKYQ